MKRDLPKMKKGNKGTQTDGGLFHMLSNEMRTALLLVARRDAEKVQKFDTQALDKQRDEKEKKEQIKLKYNMDCATESFIDAIYYHEMYNSEACWRVSRDVDRGLKKLKSNTAKINALKENIRMRVLGLGWRDLSTPWSKNGEYLTTKQLADHLKMIIKHQRTQKIPLKPPIHLPKRKELPTLGTKTNILSCIEKNYIDKTDEFEIYGQNLWRERELVGIGDRYTNMQPLSMPLIDNKLIGKRLDVCHTWDLEEGGTELRWSQGEVIEISNGSNILKPGAHAACYKKGEAVMIK